MVEFRRETLKGSSLGGRPAFKPAGGIMINDPVLRNIVIKRA